MTDPVLYPHALRPRLDPKPWGGTRLAQFGFALPPGALIGEAVITAAEAMIHGGPLAGTTVGELVADAPTQVIGNRGLAVTGGRAVYPILLKLIDAHANLSIQVHPDDAAAARLAELGKTETYHVLPSAPGAESALGLLPGVSGEEFAAACRAGQPTARLMRWLPARTGESILIPAGTIHALGAGCLVFEAQQPSDLTYRLDDWKRLGVDGKPRDLHIEPGLAVIKPELRPEPNAPLRLDPAAPGVERHLLTACRYLALERLALNHAVSAAGSAGSPQTFTLLRGAATIATTSGSVTADAGETVLIAAAAGEATITAADALILRAWVPELRTEIVTPALAAGHPPAAIAALAGNLPDLRTLLVPAT